MIVVTRFELMVVGTLITSVVLAVVFVVVLMARSRR
jgi:hypothetical protein